MEAVMLNIYSPWQIEMLSAADIPAEKITEWTSSFYGVIPIQRGSYDRSALSSALSVLQQKGVIGLFPEGGIWQPGKMEAHPGIAWLSYRSGAPVLPVGFNDTTGALNAALSWKRPALKMYIGELLSPASLPSNTPKKIYLQSYANQVMDAVHKLIPPSDLPDKPEVENESFELVIQISDQSGSKLQVPDEFKIEEPELLAKFFHRPAILKIFKVNLKLPIDALQQLHTAPDVDQIAAALRLILNYLEKENPHLLTYRFGIQEGIGMQRSLEQLFQLCRWAAERGVQIKLQPIRRFFSTQKNQEVTQINQGKFQAWM
jgi:1-acyl-sn-glycerol-3-phosphate acyltransferase